MLCAMRAPLMSVSGQPAALNFSTAESSCGRQSYSKQGGCRWSERKGHTCNLQDGRAVMAHWHCTKQQALRLLCSHGSHDTFQETNAAALHGMMVANAVQSACIS